MLTTALVLGATHAAIAQEVDRTVLPILRAPFHGTIGTTYATSTPDPLSPIHAPSGAPNVILVLLDDQGYGQSGTFGGLIPTPTLDRLAAGGLRYTRFHVTALCSPTRAVLLTGRNHHAVRMGVITNWSTDYPGYNSSIPKSAALISEILRDNGYATAALGKWHLIPENEASLAPDKPFFVYYPPGASHAPLQAPKERIDRFKGQFDMGWDRYREIVLERQKKLGVVPSNTKLTPGPSSIPAWDSLTPDQKKVSARLMEVYAGFTAQSDHELGRVIDAIAATGQLDNTLIIYIAGDNGASLEGGLNGTPNAMAQVNGLPDSIADMLSKLDELGGPHTTPHYPVGWAWAGNAPFQWASASPRTWAPRATPWSSIGRAVSKTQVASVTSSKM